MSTSMIPKRKGISIFKQYRTDAVAIDGGSWKTDYEADIDVLIRSSKSQVVIAAQEIIDERNLPYHRRKKPIPKSVQAQNGIELCVAMIANWRLNSDPTALPEGENGEPLACTPENVALVAELEEFRVATISYSVDYANYRAADLEDRAKNSETSGAQSSGQMPVAVAQKE